MRSLIISSKWENLYLSGIPAQIDADCRAVIKKYMHIFQEAPDESGKNYCYRLRRPVQSAGCPSLSVSAMYTVEIYSYRTPIEQIKEMNPKGIILTGGPNSVYEEGACYMQQRNCLRWAFRYSDSAMARS